MPDIKIEKEEANGKGRYVGRIAGIDGEAKDALELDPSFFSRLMDINVRGLLVATQSAARAMTADGAGGSVVLVATCDNK